MTTLTRHADKPGTLALNAEDDLARSAAITHQELRTGRPGLPAPPPGRRA